MLVTAFLQRSHSVSTVEKLLDLHGLKQFSDVLVANGYDDINFISEVSSEELEEIGVHSEADRVKVGREGGREI